MNNKSFTSRKLVAIAAMFLSSFAISAQAQTLKVSPKNDAPATSKAPVAKIDPAANQNWWGIFAPDMNRVAVGTQQAGTFNMAFHIKPGNEAAIGNKIKAIRFYLRDKSALKDIKIWVSKTLPNNVNQADYHKDLDISTLVDGDESKDKAGKVNDVLLDTPYDVGTEGAYVGMIFTVPSANKETAKFPIVLGSIPDVQEACLLGAPGQKWGDLYGNNLGVLAMQVLVEGTFKQNAAIPYDFSPVYVGLGQTKNPEIRITNMGNAGISSFDYTITTNGVAGPEKHVDIATPYKVFGGILTANISIEADQETGTKQKTITITKVNGVANESQTPSCKGNLVTMSKEFNRVVVMEEYTGLGCGWCPRGFVGMKKARETYPNNFIGIALHNFGSDPMSISNYERLNFSGAPQCKIDREISCDPYNGSTNQGILVDIKNSLGVPATAGVDVKGELTNNNTEVKVTVNLETINTGRYSVAYVLIADSLYNSNWRQSNFFSQYSASQWPEDLKDYCKGGKFGTSTIVTVFDDVAVSSSYNTAGVNQAQPFSLQKDVVTTQTYTLRMPTKKALKEAIKLNHLTAVAILIDSKGKIVNAGKAVVTYDPTGIEEVNTTASDAKEVARYTIDGRRINAPQRGVNIVKYSDGKTIKELVK